MKVNIGFPLVRADGRAADGQRAGGVRSRDYGHVILSVKSKLQHPPRVYLRHLTPLTSQGGGNLIIRVFQGVGNLILMRYGWGI